MTEHILTRPLSRRRFLSISAVAAGATLLGGSAMSAVSQEAYRWQGLALGAEADLTLYAPSRAEAMEAIAASISELARLEAIFSLHQPESALVRLNRAGVLEEPPQELVELLSAALNLARESNGLFDPTIQPLWLALAEHFRAEPLSEPDADDFREARALVNHRGVEVQPSRISLARPGMAVTLNGIAQGYISDRVAALLTSRGFGHALVNMGEAAAIGPKADGSAWELTIPDPRDHGRVLGQASLTDGAAATSSGGGLIFDKAGRFTHIVNPPSVLGAPADRSVTVLAPSAALADGLSTLAALAGDHGDAVEALIRKSGARALILTSGSGAGRWIG